MNDFMQDLLNTPINSTLDNINLMNGGEAEQDIQEITRLHPELELPSYRQLSYSGLLTLHSCPQKYQLSKLKATQNIFDDEGKQSLTFQFGHTVGAGIQDVFAGLSLDDCIWKAFLGWECDLYEEQIKTRKSFSFAISAITRFHRMRADGYLEEYELATFEGRPAIELSFKLDIGNAFFYRGHVDVVLKHRITGALLVVELKTNGGTSVNPATYKNSGQAIGYSIILDTINPGLSEYTVEYLVYSTRDMEFIPFQFPKALVARSRWIQEILLDARTIAMYEETGIFPMHGESCFQWYRECEYYGICSLDTQMLKTPALIAKDNLREETINYQINLSILDLLNTQQAKEQFDDSSIDL